MKRSKLRFKQFALSRAYEILSVMGRGIDRYDFKRLRVNAAELATCDLNIQHKAGFGETRHERRQAGFA